MPGMLLTPTERDRLLLFTAAELARARRARGLRLNVPETIALVADTVCEAARDGARHAEALAAGRPAPGAEGGGRRRALPALRTSSPRSPTRPSSTTAAGSSSGTTRSAAATSA